MYINDKCLYVLTWKHIHDMYFFFKRKVAEQHIFVEGNFVEGNYLEHRKED